MPQGINMGGNSGSREPDPSFTGSGPPGFDPGRFGELAERCEKAAERGEHTLLWLAYDTIFGKAEPISIGKWPGWKMPDSWERMKKLLDARAYLDAAIVLVDKRALWAVGNMEEGAFARVCWPMPDGSFLGGYVEGHASSAVLSLCAAALRGHAIAAATRRAKTPKAVECEAWQSGA